MSIPSTTQDRQDGFRLAREKIELQTLVANIKAQAERPTLGYRTALLSIVQLIQEHEDAVDAYWAEQQAKHDATMATNKKGKQQ